MMLRHCCVCREPFTLTPAHRTRVVCYAPACAQARAKARRAAFEARKRARQECAVEVLSRPPIVVSLPPPSPARPVVLPDGTTAEIVWAGDMISGTGERGGLLGYVVAPITTAHRV